MTVSTDRIRGSITALITPFKNGELDEGALRHIVTWQIAEGTNGLVPVGTTGESPTLSHKEHMRVVELCVQIAAGKPTAICERNPTIHLTSFRSLPCRWLPPRPNRDDPASSR